MLDYTMHMSLTLATDKHYFVSVFEIHFSQLSVFNNIHRILV